MDPHPHWNSTCMTIVMPQEKTRRYMCSQMVSVVTRKLDGGASAMSGNLEEIGEDSALVLSDQPVNPGTPVEIRWKSGKLKGMAELCFTDPTLGYYVEVALEAGSRWSKRLFQPDHLLNLDELMPKGNTLKLASGY